MEYIVLNKLNYFVVYFRCFDVFVGAAATLRTTCQPQAQSCSITISAQPTPYLGYVYENKSE